MKKIIALLLCFAFVFAFAACKKSDDAQKPTDAQGETVAEDAEVPEDDAQEATDAQDETEAEVQTDANGETVEAPAEESKKDDAEKPTEGKTPAAPTAPVNGSKAAVVKYFNDRMTALKQFKGKVSASKKEGTKSYINSISPEKVLGKKLEDIAQPLLPNDYPKSYSKTFNGGKSGDETLAHFLPANDLKAYNVTTAAVKTASCVKSGAGYKVTIKLNYEKGSGLDYVPKFHSQCFDTLSLTNDDFKPFTPKGTTVEYLGGTFSFETDAQGRVVKIDVLEPARVDSGLAIFGVEGVHANFNGDWQQHFTLKY